MEKKKFQQSVIEKKWRKLRNRASMSESEHKKKKRRTAFLLSANHSFMFLSIIYVIIFFCQLKKNSYICSIYKSGNKPIG